MSGARQIQLQAVLAVLLMIAAVVVRGLEAAPPTPVTDGPVVGFDLREPLQLLRPSSAVRLAELDDWIGEDHRGTWVDARTGFDRIEGCPSLKVWIRSEEGQRFERLLDQLREGERAEVLGALALVFRLAAETRWEPGVGGGPQSAEFLGSMLQDWLADEAAAGITDPVLYEPTLAAVVLYGRVMEAAYEDGLFGDSGRSLERARAFLRRLTRAQGGFRSEVSTALEERYPSALPRELEGSGFLSGLAAEARLLFPEIDGTCDG